MNQTKTTRNLWPIAIIGFFAVFITFMAGFITFAARQRMDLVRADYYEDEILYQRQIDRVKRTHPVRSEVAIALDAAQERLNVTLPVANSESPITGRIHLYRPSNASLDRELDLALKPDGTRQVAVKDLLPGLWRARLIWSVDGQEFYCDQPLVIGSKH
ncbi:MAG: FixH family protein [Verrucomicrobia bacterium]|nr:FixH family protein [Verrucomicrobiota bacterium]